MAVDNLQAQFGLARESSAWAEQLLAAAQARATPATLARAHGHRANRLSELATLPGEDRGGRLRQALAAYDEALRFRRPDTAPLDYAMTQNNRASLLSDLATLPGEDRGGRLRQALRCAFEAITLFERYQQAQYLAVGRRVLRDLRRACGDDFAALWRDLDLGDPPPWLHEDDALAAFRERLEHYQSMLQAADAKQPAIAVWHEITILGETLLEQEAQGWQAVNWMALRQQLASNYNTLGNALAAEDDKVAVLAAYERAIALQPEVAMWQRNRAGTLIELGRLDEARMAIDQARTLEPDAPRLAVLEAEWTAAHTVV